MLNLTCMSEISFSPEIRHGNALPPKTINKRANYLKEKLGFSQKKIDRLKNYRPSLYSRPLVDKYLSDLENQELFNPNIANPPSTLGHNTDEVDQKITDLKNRGFSNPKEMIRDFLPVLDYDSDNIDQKINDLKKLGFINPQKMIEDNPRILSYSLKKNIKPKIRLLNSLNKTYNLNLDPLNTIESNLAILGTKFEKLVVIVRVLRDYQPSPEDIQKKISGLYATNLESLLVAYSQKQPNDTFNNLIRRTRNIQKQKLTKEYKRELIKDFFTKNPVAYKIYRDYLKGYPEEKQN